MTCLSVSQEKSSEHVYLQNTCRTWPGALWNLLVTLHINKWLIKMGYELFECTCSDADHKCDDTSSIYVSHQYSPSNVYTYAVISALFEIKSLSKLFKRLSDGMHLHTPKYYVGTDANDDWSLLMGFPWVITSQEFAHCVMVSGQILFTLNHQLYFGTTQ